MHSENAFLGSHPDQLKANPVRVKPARADPHNRIPASTVRYICGGVSDMTLHRWLNDQNKAFPRPIYIGRRRYWREADIIAWLNAQAEVEQA
jgi:predicted DNA-binding transcriptional regulator AlpA